MPLKTDSPEGIVTSLCGKASVRLAFEAPLPICWRTCFRRPKSFRARVLPQRRSLTELAIRTLGRLDRVGQFVDRLLGYRGCLDYVETASSSAATHRISRCREMVT